MLSFSLLDFLNLFVFFFHFIMSLHCTNSPTLVHTQTYFFHCSFLTLATGKPAQQAWCFKNAKTGRCRVSIREYPRLTEFIIMNLILINQSVSRIREDPNIRLQLQRKTKPTSKSTHFIFI